jgi:16S rRNA (adenine1518-N6/adenine1519-N6)-dimethyltransferase
VLGRIVDAANIGGGEVVCEAGTGNGILTRELCRRAQLVVSYEVDKELFAKAQALDLPNLRLFNADVFRAHEIEFDVFCSNLPYSRSRDAMQWLATKRFDRAIVMVQQEFADKLGARQGNENYRAISAICSHCFKVERLFAVGRDSFDPPPRVESQVIRLLPVNTISADTVKKVNRLFSQRNKKASSVAAKVGVAADYGKRRLDQLAPAEIVRLAESSR